MALFSEAELLIVEDRWFRRRYMIYVNPKSPLYNLEKFDTEEERFWMLASFP